MVRSINTSLTTLLSIVAILVFGGASLKTFIVTMFIGMIAGSYSSIFTTPIVYYLNKRKNIDDMAKLFLKETIRRKSRKNCSVI